MKPRITIPRATLEQGDLCHILIDARAEMISTAAQKAREETKTAIAVSEARMNADRLALQMSKRCMHVNSMREALEIVKEYVDVEIL